MPLRGGMGRGQEVKPQVCSFVEEMLHDPSLLLPLQKKVSEQLAHLHELSLIQPPTHRWKLAQGAVQYLPQGCTGSLQLRQEWTPALSQGLGPWGKAVNAARKEAFHSSTCRGGTRLVPYALHASVSPGPLLQVLTQH